MAVAIRLFPHVDAQTQHSGSFLSPAIRWEAKRKLDEIAAQVIEAGSLSLQSRKE